MTRVRCDNCKCVLQMEIPPGGVTEVRLRCGNCNCLLEVALPKDFSAQARPTKAPPGTRTTKRKAKNPPARSQRKKVQRQNSIPISEREQEGIEVLLDLAAASSEETASDSPLVSSRSGRPAQPKPAQKQLKKRKGLSAKHGAPIESPKEAMVKAEVTAAKQAVERAERLRTRINGAAIPGGATPPAAFPSDGGHQAVRAGIQKSAAAAAPTGAPTPKTAVDSRSTALAKAQPKPAENQSKKKKALSAKHGAPVESPKEALAKAVVASEELAGSRKLKASAAMAAAERPLASPSPELGDLSTGDKGRSVMPKSTAAGAAPPESLASDKVTPLIPQVPPNKAGGQTLPVVRLLWNP